MSSPYLRTAWNVVAGTPQVATAEPVEYFALTSPVFRNAVNTAIMDSESLWAPDKLGRQITEASTVLHGEITEQTPFQILIDEKEYLIMAGMRTQYSGGNICTMSLLADGINYPTFTVSNKTSRVMFMQMVIVRPAKNFGFELKGTGKLEFEIIGERLIHAGPGWSPRTYQTLRSDLGESGIRPSMDDGRLTSFIETLEPK